MTDKPQPIIDESSLDSETIGHALDNAETFQIAVIPVDGDDTVDWIGPSAVRYFRGSVPWDGDGEPTVSTVFRAGEQHRGALHRLAEDNGYRGEMVAHSYAGPLDGDDVTVHDENDGRTVVDLSIKNAAEKQNHNPQT
jgi:hypothetical protein